MSQATANEISIDAAVAVVLSHFYGIFKEEQRGALKKYFCFTSNWFLQEFSKIPLIK